MKGCSTGNAVLGHSGAAKPETFLNLNKNYLITLRKHGTMAMQYLTKCQLWARKRLQSLNITGNKFKADKGWINRFMERKILSLRRRMSTCQKLLVISQTKLSLFTAM
jgi:hypothetical protein